MAFSIIPHGSISKKHWWPPRYAWPWQRKWNAVPRRGVEADLLNGRVLLAENALVLLLWGGLLTFLVRGERRRRAAAA